MQSLRKYSKRFFITLITIILVGASVRAGNGGGGGQVRALGVLDGSLHQIQKDSTITVEDSTFFDPANSGKLDTSYGVQNQVTVMINEASTLYLRTPFSVTVTLLISYTDTHGDTASTTRSFTVSYDTVRASTYNSRSTFLFKGAHKVTIKVLSDSSNITTWDPTSVLLIENQLTASPVFLFSCSTTVSTIVVSPSADPTADELPVSWNAVQGADQYDLEWTWVDSSALRDTARYGLFPYKSALIFRNSATRITTSGTSYNIPIIYDDSGTVFIRVRPVHLGNGYAVANAIWSSDASPSARGQYTFRGHERPLNWQSNISFAEEGKRKVVVQYYDGSLRSRQTVTKDNTTNTTIVAETYYDYQGRPAIQVMPSPTLNTIIKYTAGFNVSFNSAEYSQSNYDTLRAVTRYSDIHADSMSNDSGASRYYSPNNPVTAIGLNQFIPNARDFPFTETEYTPDNTGRINRQGGVGLFHQLGSGHETKYFYGTPDQNELDALFGTEVGDKSHYFKNMVRDANGQYSVSYVDMHGRTIATALAGVPPPGIAALPSDSVRTVTETLADPGSVSFQRQSMVSQKSLLVSKPDTFYFNYSLTPDIFNDVNCQQQSICYTCRYDLTITVTDSCNGQLAGSKPFTISKQNFSLASLRNSCTDSAMNLSFSLHLPEGSYLITNRLTVDPDVYSFYRDSIYLPNNTCTSIAQFISQQKTIAEAANPQCSPGCSTCLSSIGSWPTFWANYIQKAGLSSADTATFRQEAMTAYQNAVSSCSSLCQTNTDYDDIKSAMLQDMSPPYGQYADTTLAANADAYSIFFIPTDDSTNYLPLYKLPEIVYLDANGNPDSVYNASSGLMVEPNSLTHYQFSQNFRPSWANALLPYHPEYCRLQVLQSNNSSLLYDRRMESIDTYQLAVDSGYINPTNDASYPTANTGNIDPFTSLQGTALNNTLNNFKKIPSPNINLNIWQAACIMAACDSSGDPGCPIHYAALTNPFSSLCTGDQDMAWRFFREMYQGVKQSLFNKVLLADPAHCTPANSRQYNTDPPASVLYAAKHQPEFSDVATSLSVNKTMAPFQNVNGFTDAANQKANVLDTLASIYTANCKSYAFQWMQELAPCTVYDTNDVKTIIIPALTGLCRQACDSAHPYGASTLPSSGPAYLFGGVSCYSFQDIIHTYNTQHSITLSNASDTINCNADVIVSPLPYGNQPVYTLKPVYTRPSDCECGLINDLYNQYTVAAHGDASFAAYLLRTQKISMTDADLNSLRSMCSNTTNTLTCKYLSTPIYLPPAMQCFSGPACSSCQAINTLYNTYKTQFPGELPSDTSDVDTLQSRKNVLFQNFMNNRLGYNLQSWQYLQFMDSCKAPGVDTATSSTCTATTIAQVFNSIGAQGVDTMKDIKSTPDGGSVLVGYTKPAGSSFTSAYIIRYDSSGNVQWAKTLSSSNSSYFYKVRLTSDNGFIAVGVAYYGSSAKSDSSGRLLVVKFNAAGDTLWERTLGFASSSGELGYDIIQTHDGNYVTVGDHNISQRHAGPAKVMIVKLSGAGSLMWAKQLGITSGNDGYGVMETVGDTLVVTGRQSDATNGVHGVLFKVNGQVGTLYSSLTINDNTGNFLGMQIIAGYSTSTGYKLYNYVSLNGGGVQSARIGVINMTFDGTVTQSRRADVPPGNSGSAIVTSLSMVPTADGGWMAGETAPASPNIYWVKLDSSGNEQWSRKSKFTGTQQAGGLIQNPSGTYTALATENSSATLINLSSVGAAGCYDSVVSVNVTTIPIAVAVNALTQRDDSLVIAGSDSSLTVATTSVKDSLITCAGTGTCYTIYNGPLLCGKSAPLLPPAVDTITTCTDSTFFSVTSGMALYNTYSDSLTGNFEQSYLSTCMQAYKHERFTVTHSQAEYHFTLYYYDQAGNLLKTIPPAGVREITDTNWIKLVEADKLTGTALVPSHVLATNYRYNTLNQVVAQHTPDAATSGFYYDRLGRLTVSQNRKQALSNQYSYTRYDTLGRIVQVGQLVSSAAITDIISRNDSTLQLWLANAMPSANQITVTTYDSGAYAIQPVIGQRNMRNRVSWTALFDTAADLANGGSNAAAATYYSYDILGNVDTLLQDFGGGIHHPDVANPMNVTHNRFKKISYNFDLVSGKVNQVNYQHGFPDAFYHSYLYDAENRITNVQSSTDSLNWDNDAFYSYYAHGPLARTVLGQQQVQGINYAYTLQGWLKAINPAPDTLGSFTLRPDSSGTVVANSAYNVMLDYFNGDFKPISTAGGPDSAVNTTLGVDYRPLYNGNISSMGVNIRGLNNPVLYNYQYDQLNRLVHMDAWNRTSTLWSAITKTTDYQENIAYDPNGNIQKYHRNGSAGTSSTDMDQLKYCYIPGTNQLDHITDSVTSACAACNDITGQASGNYKYDSIGELVGDAASGIANITWTVYGKIASISKPANDTTIRFTYDAGGNRISKTLIHSGDTLTTWYVRDAQGNILSVYTYGDPSFNSKDLTQTELDVYGSSRLGLWKRSIDVQIKALAPTVAMPLFGTGDSIIFTRGNKLFELTNHLGNVLSIISDKRYGFSNDDSTVAYFNPNVVSANDYYPFGMLQPGRQFAESMLGSYRYGFNGKEKNDEIEGTGNSYDYGAREQDPRTGRFWSVDPIAKLYPYLTPYQYASNRPIDGTDLDGKEWELGTVNNNLKAIPQIRNDDILRRAGTIRTWDGQPNFWGKAKEAIGQLQYSNPQASAGLSMLYGVVDDAHVTYTNITNGRGYATHLDNSSVSSYKELITSGVNTTSLIFGGLQSSTETAVLGRLSIGMQGEWGEQAFGGNLNLFSKNFKTFDNFENGVATSAKTLDLGASTYLNKPASITTKLNGYIDKIAGFTQARGGDFVLSASDITTRELGVLTIGSPNAAQFSALRASQQYAAGQGVQFTLKSTPLSDPLIKGLLASPRPTNTQSQQP